MTELVVRYETPEQAALLSPAKQALAEMESLIIDSPEMAQTAADERAAINKALKTNEERRLSIVRKIEESKEPVNAIFRPVTEMLESARRVVDRKLIEWNQKVEKARREREAEANEKLRKEQERLAAQAQKAEAAGKTEKADAIREAAASVPTAIVLPPAPKAAGMVERITYSAECDDIVLLAAYVVEHPEERNLLAVNAPALNAKARSQKDAFRTPGCRLIKTAGIASRAA